MESRSLRTWNSVHGYSGRRLVGDILVMKEFGTFSLPWFDSSLLSIEVFVGWFEGFLCTIKLNTARSVSVFSAACFSWLRVLVRAGIIYFWADPWRATFGFTDDNWPGVAIFSIERCCFKIKLAHITSGFFRASVDGVGIDGLRKLPNSYFVPRYLAADFIWLFDCDLRCSVTGVVGRFDGDEFGFNPCKAPSGLLGAVSWTIISSSLLLSKLTSPALSSPFPR